MTITKTHLEPTLIAPETFLIHDHEGEGTAPVCVPLNTMVIRGAEPVVVDTGMAENRDQYLADVFSLVEPEDIRWVFISHDDVDHTGNLNALMERAEQRHARHQLVHDDPHGRQPRGAAHPAALGRRRRGPRRGRPRPAGRAPAHLRLPHHPGPVRPDHRRLLELRLLRHADAAPDARPSPGSTTSSGSAG